MTQLQNKIREAATLKTLLTHLWDNHDLHIKCYKVAEDGFFPLEMRCESMKTSKVVHRLTSALEFALALHVEREEMKEANL